jgi:hypothetical protein
VTQGPNVRQFATKIRMATPDNNRTLKVTNTGCPAKNSLLRCTAQRANGPAICLGQSNGLVTWANRCRKGQRSGSLLKKTDSHTKQQSHTQGGKYGFPCEKWFIRLQRAKTTIAAGERIYPALQPAHQNPPPIYPQITIRRAVRINRDSLREKKRLPRIRSHHRLTDIMPPSEQS